MKNNTDSLSGQKNQLSIDHKYGLLLCERINKGIRKEVDPERIFNYCKWFLNTYILDQFNFEEKGIFPFSEISHQHIEKSISDHRKIKRLINNPTNLIKSINLIEELLEQHIRFENRNIFNEKNINIDAYFGYGTSNQYSIKSKENIEWSDNFWE